jgi:hypothetical protein
MRSFIICTIYEIFDRPNERQLRRTTPIAIMKNSWLNFSRKCWRKKLTYGWEESVKTDRKEIDCKRVDWIQLDQDIDWCQVLVSRVANLIDLTSQDYTDGRATPNISIPSYIGRHLVDNISRFLSLWVWPKVWVFRNWSQHCRRRL